MIIMIELTKKYKSGSALEILQEAILFGDIPEGISLTQNELAESLGTSRMPVREALIALEYQGLVKKHTNQHVNVAALTDNDIHAVFSDLAVLEFEVLKTFAEDELSVLSACMTQEEYHRTLCAKTEAPLRRRTLGTMTGVYLSFVLANAEDRGKLDAVFTNLQEAVKNPADPEILRACYAVYAEVLSLELLQIRKRRKENAELEAG